MCVCLSKGEIENYIAFILQTIKSEVDKNLLGCWGYAKQENEKLMFCLSDEGYGLNFHWPHAFVLPRWCFLLI